MYQLVNTTTAEVLESFEDTAEAMDYFYNVDYWGVPIVAYSNFEPFKRDLSFLLSAYGLQLVEL